MGLIARLDFPADRRPPSPPSLFLATVVALAGSLALDGALVALAESLYPSTRHFAHFRPEDYGLLTTVGVVAACAAWPVTTRITSTPRWLFFRLAVAVTAVLYLPDLYILLRGEPARAVAFLMAMHLGIAVVSYQALVRIAGVEADGLRGGAPADDVVVSAASGADDEAHDRDVRLLGRGVWVAMSLFTAVEVVLGVAELFVLPSGRPSGLLPAAGTAVYLVHAAVGACVIAAAGAVLLVSRKGRRADHASALVGTAGVALAGIGGFVAADHPLRLLGMALMFIGGLTGVMAFGLPAVPATKLSDYPLGPLEWENRAPADGSDPVVVTDQWGHRLNPWEHPDR